LFSLFHKSKDFSLEDEVALILNKLNFTFLNSASLASISGLMSSRVLAAHSSWATRVLYWSRGLTAKRQTKRQANTMVFIFQLIYYNKIYGPDYLSWSFYLITSFQNIIFPLILDIFLKF
jgi:hypothetical protein